MNTRRFPLALLVSVLLAGPEESARGNPLLPRLNEVVTANISGPPDEYEADTSNCPVQDCEQWFRDLGESVFDGDYPDWIEIHNPSDQPLNLEGYGLSDNPSRPFKWIFPAVTIEPGGYLMVFASGKDKAGQHLHTNFKLSTAGETVVLTAPSGTRCDEIFTGGIPIDMSLGRRLESPFDWVWFDRPTPGAANDSEPFPGFFDAVTAEPPAGVFSAAIQVALRTTRDDVQIRFTRDGSEPSAESELYSGSIGLASTTVLRLRGFHHGRIATPISTHTYLIGESSAFPIVSLSTEPRHLWDPDLGIYTPGRNARESARIANYWQPWERPVHVELFEPDGSRGFALDAGVRIFGWGSRSNPQKSLAIMFRGRYGQDELNYPLFPGHPIKSFSSFVLRAGGSDAVARGAFFRDPFASGLLESRNLDKQAFRPALVFINGVYFGIQDIREKLNENYLARHHGVNPDRVDIVSRYWRRTYPVVSEGTDEAYLELENFLESADPNSPDTSNEVRRRLDLENFLDYTAAQIWLANFDWPGNNNKVWRAQHPDARWRAFLYDLDYTLAFDPRQNSASHNTLAHATQPDAPGWPNPPWTTFLIRRLLEIPEVRSRFINRIADLMNAEFLPSITGARLDAVSALYEPEMPRHIARWAGSGDVIPSVSVWRNNIETIRAFLQERSPHVRAQVQNHFHLAGFHALEIRAQPGGRIKVNSLVADAFPWTGVYFQGVPVSLEVLPAPGFRFAGWKGLPPQIDPETPRVTLDLQSALSLEARFETSPGAVNSIVIHEINYHGPSGNDPGDWVELHNGYNVPVDISGWVLRDSEEGHAFVIPEGTVMEPGAFLVLCANLEAFRTRFPAVKNTLGNLGFNLSNSSDQVRLFNARKELVDAVAYTDSAPWPKEADGRGHTLELIRPGLARAEPSSWRASQMPGGSPGAPNTPSPEVPSAPALAVRSDGTDLWLRIETEPARTYVVQRSDELRTWQNWRVVVGNGGEMHERIPLPDGTPARFLRAVVVHP